ncbi:MAG: permease-like cell division protein FtsX [Gemmatimonadaceae bacterium]
MRLALREVWRSLQRAPLLSALHITTMTFALLSVGLFGLVSVNIRTALRAIEDRVEVRAFLKSASAPTAVRALMDDLKKRPTVAVVGYVSSDSALRRAQWELAEFRDVMAGTTLPASVEVRLRPDARTPGDVRRLATQLTASPLVEDVRYGDEWIDKLYRLRTLASLAGLILGGTFALVALIISGATIRLAILARARELEIMRLVGATNAFVRLPYVLDGALKGLVGGLLALGLTAIVHTVLSRAVFQLTFFRIDQIALGLVAGVMMGAGASWVAVSRQLRRVWPD